MMSTEHDETTQHARGTEMADGLRAYAGILERHPRIAAVVRYGMGQGWLDGYLTQHDGDPRTVLAEFAAAATDTGARVSVDNGHDRCRVVARFGPVKVSLSADAELMAGHERRPRVDYVPLDVPAAEGGAAT